MHVAERYGTLVTANLHYGDNHTGTTDDPNELRDFAGVAAEMTLLKEKCVWNEFQNHRRVSPVSVSPHSRM